MKKELLENFRGFDKNLLKQFDIIDPFKDEENQRRCGNSTRLANKYIDYLFKNNNVIVIDHYCGNNNDFNVKNNIQCSYILLDKIIKRLEYENGFNSARNKLKLKVEKLYNGYPLLKFLKDE